MRYVLLDFDGLPIRYFDYPATGTVRITFDRLIDICGECLL